MQKSREDLSFAFVVLCSIAIYKTRDREDSTKIKNALCKNEMLPKSRSLN
ncbi:MAG: hypothetical protein ABI262_17600 [Microcoleus sp.]|jgi:hypothetical protein